MATVETFTFAAQDGRLVAVAYNEEVYGPSGFTLTTVSAATAVAPESVQPDTPSATVDSGASAAAAAPAGPTQGVGLTGSVWLLEQIQAGGSSTTVVPDPSQYTLTLFDDGTVAATAECNSGAGTYQVDGDALALQVQWSAGSCPATSLARQYANYLGYANAFQQQDGVLVIFYNQSSGQMRFAAGK